MPVDRFDTVRAGYVALTDCAPLIVAQELGFDAQEGFTLEPVRMASWTAVRDGLAFEQLECAQMPGAMSLAMHLGLSGMPTRMRVPLLLGHGGNAITLSTALYREGAALLDAAADLPRADSAALVAVAAAARRTRGERRIRLGAVHAFSSHNYELRAWLAHAGLDPDRDVELMVVARTKMVEALATGEIDGFCVGDPWAAMAVEAGIGHIVATKADLYPYAPEKVLAFREAWVKGHEDLATRTARALANAMAWAADVRNHDDLAEMLTGEDYLNIPSSVVRRALACTPRLHPDGDEVKVDRYQGFSGTCVPGDGAALWLLAQMERWGHVGEGMEKHVAGVFAPLVAGDGQAEGRQRTGRLELVPDDPSKRAFDGGPIMAGTPEEAPRRQVPLKAV